MSTEAMTLAVAALKQERDNYLDWNAEDGAPEYIHDSIRSLEEALAKQEQSKPVGCKYMFNVEVEGKANAVFDTADEAVRFAMHHVYLGYVNFQIAIDTLNQGQVYMYSYGFSAVNIVPVEKRKLPTTTPQQRKPMTNENPLLVFAKECVLGAYSETELADAAFRAIEAAHNIQPDTGVEE